MMMSTVPRVAVRMAGHVTRRGAVQSAPLRAVMQPIRFVAPRRAMSSTPTPEAGAVNKVMAFMGRHPLVGNVISSGVIGATGE